MSCSICKWWRPIGKTFQNEWEQSKDGNGNGIGWCRKNPPVYGKEYNHANWPETSENHNCGSCENKTTPLERAKEETYRIRLKYWQAQNRINSLNKEIRDVGEKFDISRRKKPYKILELIKEKVLVKKPKP